MNEQEFAQMCADLRKGSVVRGHESCGKQCFFFGIEMGYFDNTEDIETCGCEKEKAGLAVGRDLAGRSRAELLFEKFKLESLYELLRTDKYS